MARGCQSLAKEARRPMGAEANLKAKNITLPTPPTPLANYVAAVARDVGLNLLATVRAQLGSLDKVKRIVKVLGMVNATEDFGEQPKVINGFSDLMVEVFGETIGKHARSAVGMGSLPMQIPVEIEMVLEVE